MGKIRALDVVFDKATAVYCGGETIKGKLILQLSAPLEVKGVHVTLKGEARVRFESPDVQGETRVYRGAEEYFTHRECFGDDKQAKEIKEKTWLQAGRYEYLFSYLLPDSLPSTFDEKETHVDNACVKYVAIATVERVRGSQHIVTKPIAVLTALDLNSVAAAARPVEEIHKESVGYFCCASGTVTAGLRLRRVGWVVGEDMTVEVHIKNDSKKSVDSSSLKLFMVTTMQGSAVSAEKRKSTSSRVVTMVTEANHGQISPGSHDNWEETLTIPPVPPSKLVGCNIIHVEYALELRVTSAGLRRDLVLNVEVIIGNIPLSADRISALASSPHGMPGTSRHDDGVTIKPTRNTVHPK